MTNWTAEPQPFGANHAPLLAGLSMADGETPVPIAVDPATGGIVTSGGGGGTEYTDGATPPAHPIGPTLEFNNNGSAWATVGTNTPLPVVDSNAGSILTNIQLDTGAIKLDIDSIAEAYISDGVAALRGVAIMAYNDDILGQTYLHTDEFDNLNVLANTVSTASYPMYDRRDIGLTQISTDSAGAVQTFSEVTTDEGTSRVNFTGNTLGYSPGTATFTNGNVIVTGTGFAEIDAYYMDYVKLDADGESSWAQIAFIDSDTQITLLTPYGGSSAIGAYDLSPAATITGTGATISVASGQATIALGTNTSAASNLYRAAGAPPIRNGVMTTQFSISQRIANQDIYVGMESNTSSPRFFARFHFSGTDGTTVTTETSYNPTTAPSSSEIESNSVTLPAAANTSSMNRYKILLENERASFYINDTLVAIHSARIPHVAVQVLFANVRGLNSGAVTNTNIVVNFVYLRNYERVDILQSSPPTFPEQSFAANVLPAAVSIGALANNMSDKFGRQVVLPNGTRDITAPISQLTLTSTTTETTLIPATTTGYNDLLSVVVLNTSATANRVDFRDSTSGTIRTSVYVPAGDTRGFALTSPIRQSAVNNNWTAQCSGSVASIIISGQYVQNQ